MTQARPALAGVRIADFSRVLVGPFCTRLLGTLGAEVVRVEWRRRPDQFRRFAPYLHERHIDNSGIFHGLNYSKKSLELDLSADWGVELGLELIARSDVVIENFRAGQFAEMGFTRERIFERNPGVIYLGIGGLGQEGPERGYVAYGISLHAYSGLVALTGYPGGEGRGIGGSWADPVSGLFACTLLLAALWERRHQARPGAHYIDQSMVDCLLTTLPEAVVAAQTDPALNEPHGNRSRIYSPQGVLPVQGEDRWVAFSVQNYEQFRALIRLADLRDYDGPELFSVVTRRRIEDRLLSHLAAWSAPRPEAAVLAALRGAAIPCGLVAAAGDLARNPEFAARGFMHSIPIDPTIAAPASVSKEGSGTESSGVGAGFKPARRQMGLPWTSTHPEACVYAPPPRLGEHTREVLTGLLGCSDERADEILARLDGVKVG